LSPQQRSAPAAVIAHVFLVPAANEIIEPVVNCTGTAELKLPPLPISPSAPRPQQNGSPPSCSAQVCASPATTSIMLVSPFAVTGVLLCDKLPLPSWPEVLN